MIEAGVVGSPIRHSLSPLIHRAWLTAAGLDGQYEAYEPKTGWGEFIQDRRRALSGLNVTIPFKLDALAIADQATARARRAGAANLLMFKAGRITADNTDGEGLLAAFDEQAPGFDFAAGPVIIFGAGGAARGAAAAFVDAGTPEVRIINRSTDKARALCDLLGNGVVISEQLDDANAVINATSLGLNGGDGPAFDLDALPPSAVVMDMVYHPLETNFLARARAAGQRTVDGLAMLIGQARPSFAALFGQDPPADVDVRALCLAALGADR